MTNLASSVASSRSRIIAYWVTTVLVTAELGVGGAWGILRIPYVSAIMGHLGYPAYFSVIMCHNSAASIVLLSMDTFRLRFASCAGQHPERSLSAPMRNNRAAHK